MTRALALFTCLFLTASLDGQEFTLEVDVPAVSFDVSVIDEHGLPVTGLTPGDFEVLEDGVPQHVRYFGQNTRPFPSYVYLLFDTSGSTANRRSLMSQILQVFAGVSPSETQVSHGLFGSFLFGAFVDVQDGSGLAGSVDWQPSPQEIREMTVQSGRSTHFYHAVGEALRDALDGITERRVLIVVTDGRDSSLYRETIRRRRVPNSREDFWYGELLETVRSSGVPVSFVALNTDRNPGFNRGGTDEYAELRRLFAASSIPADYLREVRLRMEEIADVSGGQVVFPQSIDEVSAFAHRIVRDLGSGYSVGYSPPARESGGVRHITVRVPSGGDLLVRYSQTEYEIE